jgi:hypothetical protein
MPNVPSDETDGSLKVDAVSILENVIWIVRQLDDHGLEELRDLPVLELAKHISINQRIAA